MLPFQIKTSSLSCLATWNSDSLLYLNSWPLYQLHLPARTKIFFLQLSARMDSHHWDLCSPSGRVIPDHPTCSDRGKDRLFLYSLRFCGWGPQEIIKGENACTFYLILVFLLGTEGFTERSETPKAVRPRGLYIILTKSDKLWKCGKTKEKGVWARGIKLWRSGKEMYEGN